MNLKEFIQAIDRTIKELEVKLPKINLLMAANADTLITRRIQQNGAKAAGGNFDNYSNNLLPIFFFEGKGRKSAQLRAQRKKYKDGISYKQWREFNGLQTAFVDFTFSGDMWRDIMPRKTGSRGRHVYTAKIAPIRQDNIDKLRYNTRRKGKILQLSVEEYTLIKRSYKKQIVDIVRKNLKGI